MKLIQGISGCALAAGLMTFAAEPARADQVINNAVYAPLNLKLTAQYQDGNNIKKTSITAKDVLKNQGYNNNVKLAVNSDTGDIWVINKDSALQNLSTNGILTMTDSYVVSTVHGNTTKSSGIVYFDYDQAGTPPPSASVSAAAVGPVNYFHISGSYSGKSTETKVSNQGEYTINEDFSAKDLAGYGFFSDVSNVEVPVAGSADAKGKGKLVSVP
jgi:hypothetical protein